MDVSLTLIVIMAILFACGVYAMLERSLTRVLIGFLLLGNATNLLLLTVIAGENITGGMGTVAFVALLMGLCNQRFTATHYAMLSAFAAVGRIYVSPLSGVLSQSIGWPAFFIVSTVVALPSLAMLWWLRSSIRALDAPAGTVPADD